jgi:hypothetical protein
MSNPNFLRTDVKFPKVLNRGKKRVKTGKFIEEMEEKLEIPVKMEKKTNI